MAEGTDFLYPFLGETTATTPRPLLDDLAASAVAKAETSAAAAGRRRSRRVGRRASRPRRPRWPSASPPGGRLLTFGNGGSSTDAAGLAALFGQPPVGPPLPARCLVDDQAVLTALGNDVGFELVFARQVIAHGRPADIALGISTSGTSRNLLVAFDEAARRGLLTVGLAGYDGGEMARSPHVAHCLVVAVRQHPPHPGERRRRSGSPCGRRSSDEVAAVRWHDHRPRRRERVIDRIEAFRRRRPRLTDEVVTLAHGAGGKASAALVDHVFLRRFGGDDAGPANDAAVCDLPSGERIAFSHRLPRRAPPPLPRGLDRAPRRARHRQRPRRAGGPAGVAVGRVRHRGGVPVAELHEPRRRHGRRRRRRRGRHRHRRHQGGAAGAPPTACTSPPPASASSPPGATSGPSRCGPATGCWCRARSASTAWRCCSPAATSPSRPTSAPTPRRWPAWSRTLLAAAPGTRWLRDPTRGGVATVCNELAHDTGLGVVLDEAALPGAARWSPGRATCSASTRSTSPTRARSSPSSPPRRPRPPWRRCERTRSAAAAAEIGEVVAEPEGIVVLRTSFGSTRIVDMLVGDPLPADLLRRDGPDADPRHRHGAGGGVPAVRVPPRRRPRAGRVGAQRQRRRADRRRGRRRRHRRARAAPRRRAAARSPASPALHRRGGRAVRASAASASSRPTTPGRRTCR